jgi:hypothetical protein
MNEKYRFWPDFPKACAFDAGVFPILIVPEPEANPIA